MGESGPLARPPYDGELRVARQQLTRHSFSMFRAMTNVLRNPLCLERLRCRWFPVRAGARQEEIDIRTRKTFAACIRTLTSREHRMLRDEIAWYAYVGEVAAGDTHYAYRLDEFEADPFSNQGFLAWLQAHGGRRFQLYGAFMAYVGKNIDMPEHSFWDLWGRLCEQSRLILLVQWWRLFNGACQAVPIAARGTQFVAPSGEVIVTIA
jgi:hypothetical protein